MARLGTERPVSKKLTCRAEMSAAPANSSWLRRRRSRQIRSRPPTGIAAVGAVAVALAPVGAPAVATAAMGAVFVLLPAEGVSMPPIVLQPDQGTNYLGGKRRQGARHPHSPPLTSLVIDSRFGSTDYDPGTQTPPSERIMPNATTTNLVTRFTTPSSLLRKALLADALLSGITGLALALAAAPLAAPFGLAVGLLRWSGLILIPFAAFVARLGTRERIQRPLVFAVVACNGLWALDSVLLLVTGWIEPTVLGEVFVLGQALVVAVLAELEFLGLRRSTLVEAHARR